MVSDDLRESAEAQIQRLLADAAKGRKMRGVVKMLPSDLERIAYIMELLLLRVTDTDTNTKDAE